MPTYDYECQSCHHHFSDFHKMSDAAPACPACGHAVKKVPVAPAFVGAASGKAASSAPGHGCAAGACGCKYQTQ